MDTSSTLLGVSLLLVFIAPVAIFLIREASFKKKNKMQFTLLAKQHNLHFNEIEFLPNLALGLDEMSKKLLVYSSGRTGRSIFVDLTGITSTGISTTFDSEETATGSFDEVSQIIMNLTQKTGEVAKEKIIFFDREKDSLLQKEEFLKTAEKWHFLIEKAIKS